MEKTTSAHQILDAVQLATDADLAGLRHAAAGRPGTLDPELILRIILTFLPEHTDPESYIGLIKDVASGSLNALDHPDRPPQLSESLSGKQVRRRVQGLHLVPLHDPDFGFEDADPLTQFLVSRAHRIDAETGSLSLVRRLLNPFVNHSESLRAWILTVVYPLIRCECELKTPPSYSLTSFEALRGSSGLTELLARDLGHDSGTKCGPGWFLREVVGPWIRGQQLGTRWASDGRKDGDPNNTASQDAVDVLFDHLNRWILTTSKDDFSAASKIFEQWGGPVDVDLDGRGNSLGGNEGLTHASIGYAQTGLASVYACKESAPPVWADIQHLLSRSATLSDHPALAPLESTAKLNVSSSLPSSFVGSLSKIHVLPAELLDKDNPLTRPSTEAFDLAFLLLVSVQMLSSLCYKATISDALALGLFGSEVEQRSVLVQILHGLNGGARLDDSRWVSAREELHWLRNWNSATPVGSGTSLAIFGRIGVSELEVEILKALLSDERLTLALRLYCETARQPLPSAKVEEVVLEVGWKAYDNASNGNKTRGGVKKALQLVSTFQSTFSESRGLHQLSALIQATHSLSFYSLTLQHGVPLVPANIRMHQTPLSLIDKVLDQNPKSYTKLDDILAIGRNLVKAGLVRGQGSSDIDETQLDSKVERSIIASTIRSALAENDFDTAYAYIVNRLSGPNAASPACGQADDVLWKAALEAGRYDPGARSARSNLRLLEQKMELLAQALVLAPVSSIPEVLDAWQQAETEVSAASATESEDETAWRRRGDRQPPGAFVHDFASSKRSRTSESVRPGAGGEAPMGLFDVARGAAAALQKSAFPLHGQRNVTVSHQSGGENESKTMPEGRVRKRDVVSNMVTGGLASGIGWVLGAQPTKDED